MKQQVYGAVLAAAMAFSVGAFAQDQQQAPAAGQSQQTPGEGHRHGGKGMHKMDPQAQLDHMSQQLNLTDDQKTKILPILQNADQQMQSLRSDTSTQQQDKKAKAKQIHKTTMDQVRAVLTPEQQQKMDQMKQQRMEKAGKHKGGKGQTSAPATPPQSQ